MTDTGDEIPKIGQIPVRNLWLLMLYASDLYRDCGNQMASAETAPDEIPALIARMLSEATERRLHRNLTSGYLSREANLNRLRGRIDLLKTSRQRLLSKGQVACRFNELTLNTPRNCYIRTALEKLGQLLKNKPEGRRCRSLVHRLYQSGVTGDKPDSSVLSRETFSRHDADDRQLLSLSRLAFDLALPSEEQGPYQTQTPDRTETFVRKLFEKAVAGLYQFALRPEGWSVKAGREFKWPIEQRTAGIAEILPGMKTDIELSRPGSHIVIDTKFTHILNNGWYREKTLRSGYLYQMYAYLRSQEHPEYPESLTSTGILLHPCSGVPLDESVTIQGHSIRFVTVNLTDSAIKIREQLLAIICENDFALRNKSILGLQGAGPVFHLADVT